VGRGEVTFGAATAVEASGAAVGGHGAETVVAGDEAVAAARSPPISAPTTRPVVAPIVHVRIAFPSGMIRLPRDFPAGDTTEDQPSRFPGSAATRGARVKRKD
jgi:hypothetical protein